MRALRSGSRRVSKSAPGVLVLLLAIGALPLATACRPKTYPGTSAGTFDVTETLQSNACAGGFDPDAMLAYQTDVRVEGSIAYWQRGDTPIASGTYESTGHFHFIAQQDVYAYGADAGPTPPCYLRETQTIDGTLALGAPDAGIDAAQSSDASSGGVDAGVRSTGFTGTDTIQLSIAPGSDCTALFAQNGGPFTTMPCTATYAMSATAR